MIMCKTELYPGLLCFSYFLVDWLPKHRLDMDKDKDMLDMLEHQQIPLIHMELSS